jgi:hypothetical protein
VHFKVRSKSKFKVDIGQLEAPLTRYIRLISCNAKNSILDALQLMDIRRNAIEE